jgi:hypothetical protein
MRGSPILRRKPNPQCRREDRSSPRSYLEVGWPFTSASVLPGGHSGLPAAGAGSGCGGGGGAGLAVVGFGPAGGGGGGGAGLTVVGFGAAALRIGIAPAEWSVAIHPPGTSAIGNLSQLGRGAFLALDQPNGVTTTDPAGLQDGCVDSDVYPVVLRPFHWGAAQPLANNRKPGHFQCARLTAYPCFVPSLA